MLSSQLSVAASRAALDDDRDEVGPVLAPCGSGGRRRCRAGARASSTTRREDHVGLAQGGDPRGDVAQGALRVGAPGDGGLGSLELVDQPGVGDGDRGLVGQPAEDRLVDLVEGVPLAAVDLDRAERALVADDRRDDEVADAGRPRPARRLRSTCAKSPAR